MSTAETGCPTSPRRADCFRRDEDQTRRARRVDRVCHRDTKRGGGDLGRGDRSGLRRANDVLDPDAVTRAPRRRRERTADSPSLLPEGENHQRTVVGFENPRAGVTSVRSRSSTGQPCEQHRAQKNRASRCVPHRISPSVGFRLWFDSGEQTAPQAQVPTVGSDVFGRSLRQPPRYRPPRNREAIDALMTAQRAKVRRPFHG